MPSVKIPSAFMPKGGLPRTVPASEALKNGTPPPAKPAAQTAPKPLPLKKQAIKNDQTGQPNTTGTYKPADPVKLPKDKAPLFPKQPETPLSRATQKSKNEVGKTLQTARDAENTGRVLYKNGAKRPLDSPKGQRLQKEGETKMKKAQDIRWKDGGASLDTLSEPSLPVVDYDGESVSPLGPNDGNEQQLG